MADIDKTPYEQVVPDQTARLAGAVCAVPPDTPVPTCPEWNVTDLAEHVGQTQLFFTALIEDRVSSPADLRWPEATIPGDQTDWAGWLGSTSAGLVNAVRAAGNDSAIWNPAGGESGGAAYWLRRAFGELAAHRFDASVAAGQPYQLDPSLASDAISEFLEMVTSSTWAANMPESAAGMRGSGQALHWHATDLGAGTPAPAGEWTIIRQPDGPVLERGHRAGDVTIAGPASSLLPLLIRRTSIEHASADGVRITGDRSLLVEWLPLMTY